MFKDDKRFLMVKVSLNEEYPRFKFCAVEERRWRALLRPVCARGAVRVAMQWVRKKYGVLVQGTGAPKAKDLKYSTYSFPSRSQIYRMKSTAPG